MNRNQRILVHKCLTTATFILFTVSVYEQQAFIPAMLFAYITYMYTDAAYMNDRVDNSSVMNSRLRI